MSRPCWHFNAIPLITFECHHTIIYAVISQTGWKGLRANRGQLHWTLFATEDEHALSPTFAYLSCNIRVGAAKHRYTNIISNADNYSDKYTLVCSPIDMVQWRCENLSLIIRNQYVLNYSSAVIIRLSG